MGFFFFTLHQNFIIWPKKITLTPVRICLLLKKKKRKKKKMSIPLLKKTLFFWAIYHIQATIKIT